MPNLPIAQLVFLKDNIPMANTRVIAEMFGKRHCNVLRAVRDLMKKLGERECSREIWEKSEFRNSPLGIGQIRSYSYCLTRFAFILLVTGFTGKKATKVKAEFLLQFEDLADSVVLQHETLHSKVKQLEAELAAVKLESTRLQDNTKQGLADPATLVCRVRGIWLPAQ